MTMSERSPASDTMLVMAALIAAVRTALCADREFQGAYSPKVIAEVANAIIRRRAQEAQ